MSNLVPNPVRHAVMGNKGDKQAQLAADTVQPSESTRITSDWGTKQSDTDDWLKVTSGDQQGPMLLEDGFGREKVCFLRH